MNSRNLSMSTLSFKSIHLSASDARAGQCRTSQDTPGKSPPIISKPIHRVAVECQIGGNIEEIHILYPQISSLRSRSTQSSVLAERNRRLPLRSSGADQDPIFCLFRSHLAQNPDFGRIPPLAIQFNLLDVTPNSILCHQGDTHAYS